MDIIFRLNGYKELISKKKENDIEELELNTDGTATIHKIEQNINWYRKNKIRKLINIIYILFVLIIHLLTPSYILYKGIYNKDINIITSNILYILFLTQYIVGYLYVSKNNYNKIILDNNNFKKTTIFIIISSIILTVIILLMYLLDQYTLMYSELSSGKGIITKTFLIIILIIEKYYSYSILLTNSVIFVEIFYHHKKNINSFLKNFEEILKETEIIDISTIIQEFSIIKTNHKKSVESLNNIFSDIIIISWISGYFIANNSLKRNIDNIHILNLSICLLIILFYIYIINSVKNSVDDIKGLVNSEKFQERYRDYTDVPLNDELKINNFSDIVSKIINNSGSISNKQQNNIILKTASMVSTNQEYTEWLIINSKLSDNWENFKIFGFDIDDSSLFQKAIFIITTFFMLSSLELNI